MSYRKIPVCVTTIAVSLFGSLALAGTYTVAYTTGGSWSTVYVQGFNSSLGASPNPGVSIGSPVNLTQFDFFKSGTQDTAANIRLAILNDIFPSSPTVTNTTTTSPTFVGLSTNTVLSTSLIPTGDPITFTFNNLQLDYGSDYAAVFVNVGVDTGNGAPLTPVRVSALTANYVDVGGGDFHPATNYGTEGQFDYATSNFINGGFFSTFSYAGDANFRATFEAVPEPASAAVVGIAMLCVSTMIRRRR